MDASLHLTHKSDAHIVFGKFLAGNRVEGAPPAAMIAYTGNRAEFTSEKSKELSREYCIKPKFPSPTAQSTKV